MVGKGTGEPVPSASVGGRSATVSIDRGANEGYRSSIRSGAPGRVAPVSEPQDALVVTVLATEDLTAAQRASVIDVCIDAHDSIEFEHLFSFIPSGGRHFLAYRGRELVSHAVVTTRWVQPEGHQVMRTAFVDAVATLPACQGRGYATATLSRLAAEIGDYEIGCLQTDRVAFYEGRGWELWRGSLAGRGDDGLIPTPQQRGVMVLRLPWTPSVDLANELTIECQPGRIWGS